ncbi:Protein SEY1 [Candida maltosa Xu316]|uniref:Protein SEY1 n=1 Tax=Candida maltosa (strain Xu316) TaxID=1245528 RepID=M3JCX1_CANMX|nr:Protein SEY1 [Candida maltosa Xu316]
MSSELSEGELSNSTSSSSFVPVDQHQIQDAIQIVNEEKRFNEQILDYINRTSPADVGNNYHIISVFGSQSTGKSTLLNKLFNTNFDVMDESNRQQTTKGIWLAYSPVVSTTSGHTSSKSNILVMDVEGTDGRERGEDQDFERKAALFALSTSEILILNIWETQIGLYQGANMGLLKTVFEVNLSLFGKAKVEKHDDHKVLLLIVIRDHIGVTPVERLAETITQDLVSMWNKLSKPAELEKLSFDDFFDVNFHALNHKVLQPKEFAEGINKLGDRLVVNDELFKPEYHHNVPIDGWTMYAEQLWNEISSNKDLDLPTQQILVAQFKCDEIVDHVFEEFLQKFQQLFGGELKTEPDFEELGALFVDLRNDTLENYDSSASRYNQSVYEQKRIKLKGLVTDKFKEVFDVYGKQLTSSLLKNFHSDIVALKGKHFITSVQALSTKLIAQVVTSLGLISLQGDISSNEITVDLKKDIDDLVAKQQTIELNSAVSKAIKKLSSSLSKSIQSELGDPNEETWDKILHQFKKLSSDFVEKFDFKNFNLTETETEQAIEKYKFRSWTTFYNLIHKLISKDNLLSLLQNRFDDKFRYDENGLPKLYKNETELEKTFNLSKSYALKALPILAVAKLSDDSEIVPDYDIFDVKLKEKFLGVYDEDSDDEEDEHCFGQVVTEQEKSDILVQFRKGIDLKYVETRRGIISHTQVIPAYIYVIILVLGWNEFMMIIRNPLSFSLLLILSATLLVLYKLNLLKPAMMVARKTFDETVSMAKEKLREVLIDDHETQGRNLKKISGNSSNRKSAGDDNENEEVYTENIELDDM